MNKPRVLTCFRREKQKPTPDMKEPISLEQTNLEPENKCQTPTLKMYDIPTMWILDQAYLILDAKPFQQE